MDKLAKRLRDDALSIDAGISDELDERIRASLTGITPEAPVPRQRDRRPASFWWWSTATGVTAALTIIAAINLQKPDPAPATAQTTPAALKLPGIDWQVREAVLTSPLEQEIKHLQSDLKKAEEAVKEDIDRLF